MENKINNSIKKIILINLFFIFFLGKNYAMINVLSLPGFILDLILLLLLIATILMKKLKIVYSWTNYEKLIIIYSFFVIAFYLFFSFSNDLNETGQDIIILVYPILIFIIFKCFNFKLNISYNLLIFFLSVYSIYLILDYIFERSLIVTRFLGINLININLPSLNVVALKPTEAGFFLAIFIFFEFKYNIEKYYLIYIFPGIYFGFLVTESRAILIGLLIFFFILFLENKNQSNNKKLVIFILGIILSFTFTISEDKELIRMQILNKETDVGINRVRINSSECFFENLFFKRNKNECEKSFSSSAIIDFHSGAFIDTKKQGFSTPKVELMLENFYLIEKGNGSAKNFIDILLNCQKELKNKSEECDRDFSIYHNFIKLRNEAYDELCGDNIKWRLMLWEKTIYNKNLNLINLFFGNGIGYSIPQKLVSENNLPLECYRLSIEQVRPLRNAHNTFLTLYYRFGMINFFLISIFIFNNLKILIKKNSSSIIIFALVMTFFDPILDSPIVLFPFFFMLLFLLNDQYNFSSKK